MRRGRDQRAGAGVATLPAVRQNALLQGNGANTRQDRSAGQTYAPSTVNPYFLNNFVRRNQEYLRMYNTSWEVQKMITIPVDDALKHRPELRGLSEEDARRIWDAYDEKQLDQQNRRSFIQERLFGGCIQYGVFKRDETEGVDQPLRLEKIQPGDFEAINVIDVTRLSVAEWVDDPFSPDYDRPLHYRVIGHPVDKSRLNVFDGQSIVSKATRNVLEAGRYNPLGFGESKLATLYDILRYCTGTQEGAYHLVNLASVLLVEAENLRTMKATDSQANAALEAVIEQISIYRGAVLDGKGVKVSQHSASFGSVPELLMMYLQIFSAASDVPATRFLGQAPGGLNATGDSDTQNYHDAIRAFQQQRVRPVRKRQIDWIGCDIWGWNVWSRKRLKLEIVDQPLWSETAREKADRVAIYAGLINTLYGSGIISGEAAIKELKAREAFVTDIEAADFLDKGPDMEDSPLDSESSAKGLKADDRKEVGTRIPRKNIVFNVTDANGDEHDPRNGRYIRKGLGGGGANAKGHKRSAGSTDGKAGRKEKRSLPKDQRTRDSAESPNEGIKSQDNKKGSAPISDKGDSEVHSDEAKKIIDAESKWLLQQGMNTGNEYGVLINEKSEIIREGGKSAEEWELSSEAETAVRYSSPNSLIVMHNHPGNLLYSREDLEMICRFKSIGISIIVTPDRKKYSIDAREGTRPTPGEFKEGYGNAKLVSFRIAEQIYGHEDAVSAIIKGEDGKNYDKIRLDYDLVCCNMLSDTFGWTFLEESIDENQ